MRKFSKKKPIKLFKKFMSNLKLTNKPLLERKIKISMKLKSSLERKFPLR